MTIYRVSASLATRHFFQINILVFDVALGVGVDAGLVDAGEGALDFAGVADDQAAGRDFGAFEKERACGYDAAGADVRAVQNDRAHADEAARLDGAAVEGDGVADGHVVAEDQRVLVAHDVQDAAVLDVGARAYANVVHVATNHGAGPHAGVFADDHVADDDGGGVNIGGRGDLRALAAIRANVGLAAQHKRAARGVRAGVLTRHCTLATPLFFVSVASKRLSCPVNPLDATLVRFPSNTDSKGLKFT